MSGPSMDDFNALKSSVDTLIASLLQQQQSGQQQQQQQQQQPAATQSSNPLFISPLTANPAAGTSPSPSLLSCFPEVEAAVITAIITHEFRASDLYKLDSRYRDKSERRTVEFNGSTGTLELTGEDSSLKEFKTLNSIIVPLSTYFSILLLHAQQAPNCARLGAALFTYNAHLVKMASEYEWHAVVAYHMAFFSRHRREMMEGDYSGWPRADIELRADHLYPNRKPGKTTTSTTSTARKSPPVAPTSTTCRNFNVGTCTGDKCPYGRQHLCSTCNKPEHGAHNLPKTT
ncbi:hypothetical protein BDZ89DRAFT_1080041 [Hymenopellis radicata]|nr:hypothetical protein BDZ89DRAFT_1080041 [Hymenopellis radicata]